MHYHFEGILTARDSKQHIPCNFTVPVGSAELELDFGFAPEMGCDLSHLITLTIFDPNGFRGAGHRDGAQHRVRITADGATPGYLAGPLPAGEWIVQLDTHRIMPGEPVRYTVDIDIASTSPLTSPSAPPLKGEGSFLPLKGEGSFLPPSLIGRAVRGLGETGKGVGGLGAAEAKPGWYRGDLHTHTIHSDAEGVAVADLLAMARRAGLDFIFLTDHNTTAGHAEIDAAAEEGFLPAVGLELTTFWGHAVCLGTRQWVDWRIRPGEGAMARIADALYAAGQAFIIAHPQSAGDPCCTGCAWRFGDMMPGNARLVEVWNGPWAGDSGNEASLALWYDWLNQGYRLVATAGSDLHAATDYNRRPGFNVVYAEALTDAALIEALLAGHLYLSAGPRVSLQARDVAGTACMMGDAAAGPAEFALEWVACPPDARLRVIVDGKLLVERPAASDEGSHTWHMAAADGRWVLVEIRSRDGQMLALTNPIFLS